MIHHRRHHAQTRRVGVSWNAWVTFGEHAWVSFGERRSPAGRKGPQSRFHGTIEADPRAAISRPNPGLGSTPYYPTWVRPSINRKSLQKKLVKDLLSLFAVNSR
jgi:hypothetical protein